MTDDVDAERREKAIKSFLRFLYVGKGYPYYEAKPWNEDYFYSNGEQMRPVEILAANESTELIPIDKIKLAMDSKLVPRQETLMFALAMCARQKKSEKLRTAAYYFLQEHCKTWNEIVLFVKFATYLCKMEVSARVKDGRTIGWGRGWKNAINKWYLKHSAHNLADLVTRYKSRHGWTHKDILRLSHLDYQSIEVEKQVVIKYVMYGLKTISEEFGKNSDAKIILSYIKRVEKFRECSNPKIVVKELSKTCPFAIDHVHPKALKSRVVWGRLLRKMDLSSILKNIPKMTKHGLLEKESRSIEIVVRNLESESDIQWCRIMPADVIPILNLYEKPPCLRNQSRDLKVPPIEKETEGGTEKSLQKETQTIEKKEKPKNDKKRPKSLDKSLKKSGTIASKETPTTEKPIYRPKPIKPPDMRILDALRSTLKKAQKTDITGSGKRRYLIAMRAPAWNGNDLCAETGLCIALPLLHRDPNFAKIEDDKDQDLAEASSSENVEKNTFFLNELQSMELFGDDEDLQNQVCLLAKSLMEKRRKIEIDKSVIREKAIDKSVIGKIEIDNSKIRNTDYEVTIFLHEPSRALGEPVAISKDMDYDEALNVLLAVNRSSMPIWKSRPPLGPCQWSVQNRMKYDVFINVMNEPPKKKPDEALQKWREMANSIRVINVYVPKGTIELKKQDLPHDALTINGFDRHVPFIIEAYVRGLF